MRIAHDEAHLYVWARLWDSRPEDVRANSLYRDQYAGDDTVGVVVDALDDDRTGLFSTLGLEVEAGRAVMGLSAYRWLARHNERHVWPNVRPEWARAYARPSLLQDVLLEGVESRRALVVTPYALVGRSGSGPSLFGREGMQGAWEAGGDVKAGLGEQLTLDVTLNTDFAQAEADDEAINLSRFPLFFPEKRQFFLERAGLFDFPFTGSNRLFHSRRIGLVDGRPVRMLGGARVVGRLGEWELGALDMQAGDARWRPTENFGVLRVRRPFLNDASRVGAMFTSRLGVNGRAHLGYDLDGDMRLFGDEFLTLRWAQSVAPHGTATEETGAPARGDRLLVSWE